MKMRMMLVLIMLACGASREEEVQEMGRVDSPSLKEAAQTGGFFSALMTSGSFTMMQAGSFEEEEEKLQLGEDSTDLKAENAELKRLLALKASSDKEEAAPMTSPTSRTLLGPKNVNRQNSHCGTKLMLEAQNRMQGKSSFGTHDSAACDLRQGHTCRLWKTQAFRLVRRKEGEHFFNALVGAVATTNTDCNIVKRWAQLPNTAAALNDPLVVDLFYRKDMHGTRKCYCSEEETQRSSATRVLLGKGSKSTSACTKCKLHWTVKKTCRVTADVQANLNKFCNSANKNILCSNGKPDLLHDPAIGAACTIF
jgi:hypothetical protein